VEGCGRDSGCGGDIEMVHSGFSWEKDRLNVPEGQGEGERQ